MGSSNSEDKEQEQLLTFYKNIVALDVNAPEHVLYTDEVNAMSRFKVELKERVVALIVKGFALGIIIGLVIAFLINKANAAPVEVIKAEIVKQAVENEVDPNLMLAIAYVESSFNPKAKGKIGEVGLFQFRPDMYNVNKKMTYKQQIAFGVKHFKALEIKCGALLPTCHNYGVVGAKRLKNPKKTDYYKKVSAAKKKFKQQSLIYIALNP